MSVQRCLWNKHVFVTSFSWFSIVVITFPFSNEIFTRVWWILGNSKFPRFSQFIFFKSLELYWVGFLYNLLTNATTYKSFKVSLIKKQRLKWGFLMIICSLDPLEQFQPEWILSETDEKETYTLFDRQN